MNLKSKSFVVYTVCAVLMLLGAYSWFLGYTGKPGASDLNQYTTWGLYIALFLFFEAVGAGALFIASMNRGTKYRLQLAIAGTLGVIGAGLAIMLDLGGIFSSWRLFLTPNFSSPILLDVWFVLLTIICGVILILQLSKGTEPKIFVFFTSLFAVLLPLGTAILFTTLPGRIGWSSSLEIAVFLAQAALAGICLYILYSSEDYAKISKWVSSLFLINFVLALGEIFLAFYISAAESIPQAALMQGEYAILFWLWLAAGLVLPLFLAFYAKYPALVASFGLAGILISKFLFVVKGNMYPFLRAGAGVKIDLLNPGLDGFQKVPTYVPGFGEIFVAFAVFAFLLVAYLVVDNLLTNKRTSIDITDKSISE